MDASTQSDKQCAGTETIEVRTITLMAFRDRDGYPTCCNNWQLERCRFIGTRDHDTVEVCMPTQKPIPRKPGGDTSPGHIYKMAHQLRPVQGCPVWENEQ